jgi:hypothetical protein
LPIGDRIQVFERGGKDPGGAAHPKPAVRILQQLVNRVAQESEVSCNPADFSISDADQADASGSQPDHAGAVDVNGIDSLATRTYE